LADPRALIRHDLLEAVRHGFQTGIGLEGPPDPGLIMPGSQLVLVRQVHSARALTVTEPFAADGLPEADALATATPGLTLGIVTADCAPVLLADVEGQVIGAAHAGWRGAFGGVLEATVAAMEQLGADRARIRAVIGPTIAQPSYEVDVAFRDRFVAADSANGTFFAAGRAAHFQFDLPAYVRHRLLACGVAAVADAAIDTYADRTRFHSFRRATHRGEPTYGRQFSLISL
jgi:polyphenol oxidase